MTDLLSSNIVNPEGIVVVRIARFTSDHDILADSGISIVEANADDLCVEDSVELAIFISIVVVVILSQIDASSTVCLKCLLLRGRPSISLPL